MDQKEEIREVFLEFLELERITESEIRNTILTFFDRKGTDIKNLRDQCYDGAPKEKVSVSSSQQKPALLIVAPITSIYLLLNAQIFKILTI